MVRVRVPFFFFLQVKSFFNGLDCFLNNEDSPTSVHSLSLEFHIHDLFHISIQIVCQRLSLVILLYEKFLQFDWLRAVVFQLNLKYLHVKITNLVWVVV